MPESEYVNVTEVRRWAKEAGYDVPARGALKQEIYDAYNERDEPETKTADTTASDEPPAGHTDASGITDEVTTTVTSNESDADEQKDEQDPDTDDAYNTAWRAATGFDTDWAKTRELRNRVSVQTLDNGFIHAQRATGTDEIQARLVERGFLNSPAHGVADETTVQAYARFQDSIGLPGTGIPERDSLEALGFDVIE